MDNLAGQLNSEFLLYKRRKKHDKTLDQFINAVLYYQADSLGNSVSFWAED